MLARFRSPGERRKGGCNTACSETPAVENQQGGLFKPPAFCFLFQSILDLPADLIWLMLFNLKTLAR
jgi:hypothetical protein